VREKSDGSVFIEGLNEFQCKKFEDVLAFMKMGNKVKLLPPLLSLSFYLQIYCFDVLLVWRLMLGRSARRQRR